MVFAQNFKIIVKQSYGYLWMRLVEEITKMASFLIGDHFEWDVMGPYGAFLEAKIKKEAIFVISLTRHISRYQ